MQSRSLSEGNTYAARTMQPVRLAKQAAIRLFWGKCDGLTMSMEEGEVDEIRYKRPEVLDGDRHECDGLISFLLLEYLSNYNGEARTKRF